VAGHTSTIRRGILLARNWLSRNLDDEGRASMLDSFKRIEFIGFMALNLARPTSLCSRIIEIAGEPRNWIGGSFDPADFDMAEVNLGLIGLSG
jgi:hypothetical protein